MGFYYLRQIKIEIEIVCLFVNCEPLALGSDAVDGRFVGALCCSCIVCPRRILWQAFLTPMHTLGGLDTLGWVQVLRAGVQVQSFVVTPFIFLALVLAVHFNLRLNTLRRTMPSHDAFNAGLENGFYF